MIAQHWTLVPPTESAALQQISALDRILWVQKKLAAQEQPRDLMSIARDILWHAGLHDGEALGELEAHARKLDPCPTRQEILDALEEGYLRASSAFGPESFGARMVAEMSALVEREKDDERPDILKSNDTHRYVEEVEKALATLPDLFERGGRIVRVVRGARPPKASIVHAVNALSVRVLLGDSILDRMSASAKFWKRVVDEKGKRGRERIEPPMKIAKIVAANSKHAVPTLLGMAEIPIVRPDGTILDSPGYDQATGFLYTPSIVVPPGPKSPSKLDALDAAEQLLGLFHDFPFKTPAHRSAALAFLLTLVGRAAIEGNVPMFAIDASDKAAGKGLLADVIATIVYGGITSKILPTEAKDELDKLIFAVLRQAEPFALLDNWKKKIRSGALEAALTANGLVSGRVLGLSETATIQTRTVLAVTGNNLQFAEDLVRRVVPIRLVGQEDAYKRTNFRHPKLLRHVAQNRGHYVRAALTIFDAYFCEGCPKPQLEAASGNLGSFEGWSDLIRPLCVWLGLPDPIGTREEIEQSDDLRETESEFLAALQHFAGRPDQAIPSKKIHAIVSAANPAHISPETRLREALFDLFGIEPEMDPPGPKKIGERLNTFRERVRDGRLLDRTSGHDKVSKWFVRPYSAPASGGE
jgi:hypothetical protein